MAMKLALPLALLVAVVSAGSPVEKVVKLLKDLQEGIISDGKKEQESYDKYACWCEKNLSEKADEITEAKDLIEELTTKVMKLRGGLGEHFAEIANLKKQIAENIQATRSATALREKENNAYNGEREQEEQCIGALEAAIEVMTGAGAGKKKGSFLANFQEAQLLSIVAGVKDAMVRPQVAHTLPGNDLDVVRRFVQDPEQFVPAHRGGLSAAQIAKNPFGDYAPQSSQIQGILKSMYDSFASDLEKENVEEADKQKAFEELMETKKEELKTLEKTLEEQEANNADKTKKLSDAKATIDDTQDQLRSDEKFFVESKKGCKAKAKEWAARTGQRTLELQGIEKAIEILNSPEAKKMFADAVFLQVSSTKTRSMKASPAKVIERTRRTGSYATLKGLATKYQSVGLAQIAIMLKTGGHFDKVIVMIDKMIAELRKEEKEDIAQRDRCQAETDANDNEIKDLEHLIQKTEDKIERMKDTKKEMEDHIKKLEDEIEKSEKALKERTELRDEERQEFEDALKIDQEAVKVVGQAIEVLRKYYKKLFLLQGKGIKTVKGAQPTATISDAGSTSGEGGGVVQMLEMIQEDLEAEIKVARQDDTDAQVDFEADRKDINDVTRATRIAKVTAEKELAAHEQAISDTEGVLDQAKEDKGLAEEAGKTIFEECEWVDTHFESRRDKRKTEIQGLMDAKNTLAGAEPVTLDDLDEA